MEKEKTVEPVDVIVTAFVYLVTGVTIQIRPKLQK